MKFKGIIFDLDGTLIDSLDDLADAMNLVLRANGFPEHPVAAYRYFIGDGIDLLVRRALPEDRREPENAPAYVAAMKTEYARRWTRKTRPYTGIPELLDACRATGVKMAVLTNKPDGPTQEVVAALMPDAGFQHVWGAGPDRPRKPDPRGAVCLAGQLGVRPGQCVFLGDMPVDMETARSAGMHAAGALWGFRTPDELLSAGAQVLVRKPLDLLPWISRG